MTNYRAIPHEDLAASVEALLWLLPELVALVPETASALEADAGGGTKRVHAPLPWNSAAALAFFEIHGDGRRFESLLTLRLFDRAKYRSGSGRDTVEALRRLPDLIRYGRDEGLPDLDLDDPTAAVTNWPKRVRVLLGQDRPGDAPPRLIPGGACCPLCDRTLLLSAGWQTLAEDATAHCSTCLDPDTGTAWERPVTDLIGLVQHEELLTVEDLQARFEVSPNTVRSWKRRGRIHRHGEDERGRHLFRASDVRALLDGDAAQSDALARRAEVRAVAGLPDLTEVDATA